MENLPSLKPATTSVACLAVAEWAWAGEVWAGEAAEAEWVRAVAVKRREDRERREECEANT